MPGTRATGFLGGRADDVRSPPVNLSWPGTLSWPRGGRPDRAALLEGAARGMRRGGLQRGRPAEVEGERVAGSVTG